MTIALNDSDGTDNGVVREEGPLLAVREGEAMVVVEGEEVEDSRWVWCRQLKF